MSTDKPVRKVELVKDLLKSLKERRDAEELKRRFRDVIAQTLPSEIVLTEQELVRGCCNYRHT